MAIIAYFIHSLHIPFSTCYVLVSLEADLLTLEVRHISLIQLKVTITAIKIPPSGLKYMLDFASRANSLFWPTLAIVRQLQADKIAV